MGIEKASCDGGAKDGGEVSLEGACEVVPAAKAALELHNSSRTAEAALELYSRAHVKWLRLQAGRT